MKYVLITADGKISEKDGMSLEEMQAFVGGYIEHDRGVYCNEEGLLKHLPRNVVNPRYVGNIIVEKRKMNRVL